MRDFNCILWNFKHWQHIPFIHLIIGARVWLTFLSVAQWEEETKEYHILYSLRWWVFYDYSVPEISAQIRQWKVLWPSGPSLIGKNLTKINFSFFHQFLWMSVSWKFAALFVCALSFLVSHHRSFVLWYSSILLFMFYSSRKRKYMNIHNKWSALQCSRPQIFLENLQTWLWGASPSKTYNLILWLLSFPCKYCTITIHCPFYQCLSHVHFWMHLYKTSKLLTYGFWKLSTYNSYSIFKR